MDTESNDVELKSVVSELKRTRFQVNLVDSETPPRVRLDSVSSDDKYKSFRQLTREALPRLDNYRNIMSVHVACRPTLDELHNCDLAEKVEYYFSIIVIIIFTIINYYRIWRFKKMTIVDQQKKNMNKDGFKEFLFEI